MGATTPVMIELNENGQTKKLSKKTSNTIKLKKIKNIEFLNKPEKLYNSICRIYKKKDKIFGAGFFMQISLENNPYYFLVTNNNVITSKDIDNRESIEIYIETNGKEEKRDIKLISHDRSNFVFFNPLEITIIEIIDSDNISKDRFLYPDINYKKGYKYYMNKSYYICGFEEIDKNKKFLTSFEIDNIFCFDFYHKLNKTTGSLICVKNSFNVIGINKEGDKEKNICFGTFIGKILNHLENNRKRIFPQNNISFYKGFLQFGLRHGKGIGFYLDGGLYDGEWANDEREGKGIFFYSNGNIYIGNWINNRREGYGIFYFVKGGIFKGEFKNNIIDGYGELIAGNGYRCLKYIGTLKIASLDNPNFDAIHFLNQ